MKKCTKCGETKELSEFHNDLKQKDGLRSWCKECVRAYAAEHRLRPKSRNDRFKLQYGITLEEAEDLYHKQEGKCAICGEFKGSLSKSAGLYIDHDHESGKVRGLLCNSCNVALGLMKDNPDLLKKAQFYLIENKEG